MPQQACLFGAGANAPSIVLNNKGGNRLVPRLRDDVFGSMNGRVKAITSLFFVVVIAAGQCIAQRRTLAEHPDRKDRGISQSGSLTAQRPHPQASN